MHSTLCQTRSTTFEIRRVVSRTYTMLCVWQQPSKACQQLAIEHCDVQRMVDESEAMLQQAVLYSA